MLQQLIKGLKEKGLYFESPLNKIPKSSCFSPIIVLDFDKIKETYSRQIGGIETPKSCDALLIKEEEERLIFIEMKDIDQIIKGFYTKNKLQQGDLHGKLLEQLHKELSNIFLENFRPDKKIIDSWLLLVEIAHYCTPELALAPYLLHHCSVEVYFALKIDMRHFLRLRALLWEQQKRHQYHRIDIINFVPAFYIERYIS